jgi:hypothetical protein
MFYSNPAPGIPTSTSDNITNGKIIVGSCSKCGGNVIVHELWMATTPEIPQCERCYSKKKQTLPVIQME